MNGSRREFILKSILASAGVSALSGINSGTSDASPLQADRPGRKSINVFSKNFHWLDYNGMANVVAELGFDGIDLTVRPEGHVLPERVADDLPKAVEAVKKAGLNVHMIVTAITNADDQFTEPILKTAAGLGIGYYRMGWMSYDDKKSIGDNLDHFKSQMAKLAALNKKYKIRGDYQNHSGLSFGSPVWDLWMALEDLDPQWTGSQFDIMHAQVEGGNTWQLGLKLLKSHVKTIAIKDFIWVKGDKWKTEVVPLGQGMIDYNKYLRLLKEYDLTGPFSMHFEYPLGGAENGAKQITISKEDVMKALRRDLVLFKKMLSEAGIVS
ncbi:MAG TPA: sugar phosphate isomerase/epimerase family protein [Cyclobacteriaceae bacterium]|nr:sugar phosphate isomerase/epimerase family protein [Cyclobacteriaceae bacterium]